GPLPSVIFPFFARVYLSFADSTNPGEGQSTRSGLPGSTGTAGWREHHGFFIETDSRILRLIFLLVEIEHVLHRRFRSLTFILFRTYKRRHIPKKGGFLAK
ncbi:MAG TPA: hypothetical protein VEU97_06510, partial [Ktedonobacteraceae bacterium]|nr:hypothetical protein [Ktedonobacteraceae bacterium]